MSSAGAGRLNRKPCISCSLPRATAPIAPASRRPPRRSRRRGIGRCPVTARTIAPHSLIVRQLPHEGAIDLDLVEREGAQIAQARIAGAEIVHRDAHAEAAQLMQHREIGVVLGEQHRFGDLELEPLRRRARSRPAPTSPICASERERNCAGDRLTRRRSLSGQLAASRQASPQHPFADRHDEAGVLGERR